MMLIAQVLFVGVVACTSQLADFTLTFFVMVAWWQFRNLSNTLQKLHHLVEVRQLTLLLDPFLQLECLVVHDIVCRYIACTIMCRLPVCRQVGQPFLPTPTVPYTAPFLYLFQLLETCMGHMRLLELVF